MEINVSLQSTQITVSQSQLLVLCVTISDEIAMSKTRNIQHSIVSDKKFRLSTKDAAEIALLSVRLRPGRSQHAVGRKLLPPSGTILVSFVRSKNLSPQLQRSL